MAAFEPVTLTTDRLVLRPLVAADAAGLMLERWIVAGEVCDTAFYGLLRSGWKPGQPR